MLALALLVLACGSTDSLDTPVRATLDDGQVLMGEVQTETLQLITGFGTVDLPLDDIGEVQPVEGGALGGSGNHVSVWLRNGSELRGEWAAPELRMGLRIDAATVPVDLPMAQLERFQLQGGDMLDAGIVYRIRTVYGDDFVVDPDHTWIQLDNELGTFTPTLAEVLSLEPQLGVEDEVPVWRMELLSGTVLRGPLTGAEEADTLTLALALGPEEITLPIADLISIERQDWGSYESWYAAPEAAPSASQDLDSGLWFDNRRQSSFKKSR